ncbi:DUF6240 domain-containing protein [Anaerocolumna sp. MB42-C2]|uniref:DUF6240 domain-containing protein n=1 Tax=Anaerocolumna sp. MB42-C2 TaxID=3070997 RepID=UPI0027DFCD0A|nr:DUF6240 domain-containing protein [Anaerocolumna sp. MB42-C2]WMJ85448.1 DUF6240 domain-containing protein [Anaerocolumna sp. MB42-C2]
MMINGVYGTGSPSVQENTANTAPKEENIAEVKQAKNNIITETASVTADTDYTTYNENTLQNNDSEKTQEEKSTEGEEQSNTKERMTKEDYKAISEEGISLEEYNAERLTLALQRVKTQRIVTEENLTDQKENLEQKMEAVKNMADYSGTTKKIVEKLIESDMPVTEANIAKIAAALEMASSALSLTDKGISYIIKNNLEPTIENIYKAQYSGSFSQNRRISDQVFENLQGQISEIIENSGLKVNDENLQSAKWLLNNGLPVTDKTLWAYHDLNQLKNNTGEETILNKTVETYASGKSPESASLGTADTTRASQAIDAFWSISEEAITVVVNHSGLETSQINCRELKKAQAQLEQQGRKTQEKQLQTDKDNVQLQNNEKTGSEDVRQEVSVSDNLDIKTITVRRQLEEIRLKMTLDSGKQLIKNGFHLDTDSLSKIVDGLRELEDKYYKNLLKEGNAAITSENVQTLKGSIQSVEELKAMPSYILGNTLSSRSIETVEGLLSAGNECKNSLKAGETYEALMTKPRSDMGDSITKAFQNVDDILEDMKLETTQANERAVRILGYNGISITEENISYVKSYDEQVNRLMKNFQPSVAVELIKKDVNPLNIPIEELNQQIESIQNELGITEEEKYSKYLWKLEKNKAITQEERKSYIGIYRLLNTVDKTDGAALGSVLKAGQEVTMQNLLTAVRTMKSGGMDTAVDDSFGALAQLNYSRESITEQINTSFNREGQSKETNQTDETADILNEKIKYSSHLVRDVMEEISPEKLQKFKDSDEILNMSVEKLKEELLNIPKGEEENEYWNKKVEDYHEVLFQAEDAIRLLKNYEMPTSIANIQAAKDLISKNNTFYKQLTKTLKNNNKPGDTEESDTDRKETGLDLEAVSEGMMEALKSPSSMKQQYQMLEQDVNKLLNQVYENPVITSQDITTLQRINYGMSFIGKLASKEIYEIPMALGNDITNVNVTVVRNTGETGKVSINMESDTLGKVSAGITVKEQGINALITCDNRNGLDIIKQNSQELVYVVNQAGIEIKQLNYGIGNQKEDSYRYTNYNPVGESQNVDTPDNSGVKTDTLYNLAKTFLVHIKEIEDNLKNT